MEETQEVTEESIRDPKAVLEALDRAKKDAQKYRQLAEERETEISNLKSQVDRLASDETTAGYKRKIVELQVKSALKAEGIKDVDRVYKYLSHDGYELDDGGNVKGFDEDLKKVKSDLPELFDKKRRVGGGADLFSKGDVKQEMSTTEMQLARLHATR